ncbi:hypothetical protein BT93_D0432 [Corymbia citriodora subsp. variegata]|nr:hypothetical protein BT93_D0432 [Corymbia citriodora subsp. variegata]
MKMLSYARICVEISTTDKKIDKVKIKLNGVTRTVLIEYEWRPVICNKCSCFRQKCKEMDAATVAGNSSLGNVGQTSTHAAGQAAALISAARLPPATSIAGLAAVPAPAGPAAMPHQPAWSTHAGFNKEGEVTGVAAQQGGKHEDMTGAAYSSSAAATTPPCR